MSILLRAIVTGFGLKIGSELAKVVSARLQSDDKKDEGEQKQENEDDLPTGMGEDGPSV